jgi:hypothetical protein
MSRLSIGATVALVECPAEHVESHQHARVSGLWTVEEFLPYEPANYVHEPGYTLCQGDGWIYVTASDLREQVDPAAHARDLVLQREIETASENGWV